MRAKIWKMCVVGLMLASPVLCTAATDSEITAALAGLGDGYIEMGYGSVIDVTFGETPYVTGDAGIILHLAKVQQPPTSFAITVQFLPILSDSFPMVLNYASFDQLTLQCPSWGSAGPWTGVRIRAEFSDQPVCLDAVQVESGLEAFGTYVEQSASGTITAFPEVTLPESEPTALDLLDILIDDVIAINNASGIPNTLGNSLEAKLDVALGALEDANTNNDASAVNKLQAFINEVEAQADKQVLDPADAISLIAQANAVITHLPE